MSSANPHFAAWAVDGCDDDPDRCLCEGHAEQRLEIANAFHLEPCTRCGAALAGGRCPNERCKR